MGRPKRKITTKKKDIEEFEPLKVKMKPIKSKTGPIKMKLQKVKADDKAPKIKPKTKHPYQGYSPDNLLAAVKAVKEKGVSCYKAAEMYGVPKSTVHDKVVGKTNILFQRKGPSPLLSYEDEKKLVDYLLQMSSLGYLFTVTELRNLASELAIQKGKICEGNRLSPRWHKSFRTRWPVLNEKVFGNFRQCEQKKKKTKAKTFETFEFEEDGDQVQISTMADESDVCLSNYYTELHALMTKHDLLDKPQRIYCVDEVAIQYESGNPKTKQVRSINTHVTSRSETTVVSLIGCGNALGNALPPFLIYPGKKLNEDMLKGKYPGVQGICTESGLTDYVTMRYYLEKHFVEYALLGMKKNPPVMVLYDGSKSKINPCTINWAKNHNIILFVMPPASTNLTHPLERGCFSHFRDIFLKETRIFREVYNVDGISKTAICKIVSESYPQALSTPNLVETFADLGIYPYKPTIVLCDDIRNSMFEKKEKLKSITTRPPGMKDKGIQVMLKDDGALKLMKPGKKKIIKIEDDSVVDVDSTTTFLRDKKIQKMLGGSIRPPSKPRLDDSEYSESDEEEEEEEEYIIEEEVEEEPEEYTPPSSSAYYIMDTGQPSVSSQTSSISSTSATVQQLIKNEVSSPELRIEETHTYALSPSAISSAAGMTKVTDAVMSMSESESETTRVAVEALQNIANELQYISTPTIQNNCAIQNVTLNSGRMIQVVVQQPMDEGIATDGTSITQVGETVIEEVQQIEIDNSVESIIPLSGDIIENS